MHDRGITGTDDVLVLEDRELCLKLLDGVYGLVRAGQHEPRADLLIVDTAQTDPNVVTT